LLPAIKSEGGTIEIEQSLLTLLIMDRAHVGLTRKYGMADNTDGKKIIDKVIEDTGKDVPKVKTVAYDNKIP